MTVEPTRAASERLSRAPWRAYSGRSLPPQVRALSLTSFLQDVASEMVYPLLPAFLLALGGGAVVLGAMESAAEAALTLVKGWAGRASDRAGRRKPFVLAGYGLSAAVRPLLALAATALHVLLLRVVDRVGKGLRAAPRDALIADVTAPGERGFAFAYHRGLDHLGAAVGPLLAALVLLAAPGDLRLVFALATLPALLGVLNVALRVREGGAAAAAGSAGSEANAATRRPDAPAIAAVPVAGPAPGSPAPGKDAARASLPPRLRKLLVAFLLFALGNASDAFLLLAAAAAGVSPLGLTLLWSGFSFAKWAASAPGGRLADRFGARRLLLAGWLLYALVYAGFALASSTPSDGPLALGALLLLYAAYYGLTEGAQRALVVTLAGEGARGTALGAFHLVTGLGTLLASLLFAAAWELVAPAAAFLLGASLALAAALLLAATAERAAAAGSAAG